MGMVPRFFYNLPLRNYGVNRSTMKKIVAVILFVTAFSSSYSQTGIYGMFYFKVGSNPGTTLPFPIKVTTVGTGKYEITSVDSRSGNKLEYSGEFVEYDKWERLYKYRSVKKWYPGGIKRNDMPEYTTETFITCRRKLSDFSDGLKIDPNGMVEETKINITQTTSSKWSKNTQYYMIVLFNDNTVTYNQDPTSTASSKNIAKTSLFRQLHVANQILVYNTPSLSSENFAVDFYEERFVGLEIKNGFIYAVTKYNGKIWCGWIRRASLVNIGECWVKDGLIESSLTYEENLGFDSATLIMDKNHRWVELSAMSVMDSLDYAMECKAKSTENGSNNIKNKIDINEKIDVVTFTLDGRTAKWLPKPFCPGNEEGIVVVQVAVNQSGLVRWTKAGIEGTNTDNSEFIESAERAARKSEFNADENAPASQLGTITYRFTLNK